MRHAAPDATRASHIGAYLPPATSIALASFRAAGAVLLAIAPAFASGQAASQRSRPRLAIACAAALLVATAATSVAQADVTATGSYQTSVPISVPSFRGLEPRLALTYDSSAGNGVVGVGWSLSGLSTIQRASPGKGVPAYGSEDVFFLDGKELIECAEDHLKSPSCRYPSPDAPVSYTSRIESFRRIAFDRGDREDDAGRWYVWEKDGTKLTYGVGVTTDRGIYTWVLKKVEDTLGNTVTYDYWLDSENEAIYLDSISYNQTLVTFHREQRPDPVRFANGSSLSVIRFRLKAIDVQVARRPARAYALAYTERAASTGRSMLAGVRLHGRDAKPDKAEVGRVGEGISLRLAKFEANDPAGHEVGRWKGESATIAPWSPPWEGSAAGSVFTGRPMAASVPFHHEPFEFHAGDLNADGRDDWMKVAVDPATDRLRFNTLIVGRGGSFKPTEQIVTWPGPDPFRLEAWPADVNGDAKTDYLLAPDTPGADGGPADGVALLAALSRGDGTFRLATSKLQSTGWQNRWPGGRSGWQAHCQPGDVNGDGKSDLLCSTFDEQGHFVGTALSKGDGTFDLARTPLPEQPEWPGYTLELSVGDVNADGLDDAMLSDAPGQEKCWWDQPSCWHIRLLPGVSAGDGRFSFEEHDLSWDGYGELFAADINGDRRSDYVRLKHNVETVRVDRVETAVRRPDGSFSLHSQAMPPLLMAWADSVLTGDADGDGTDDLLVRHLNADTFVREECGEEEPYVSTLTRVYSRGDGTFVLPDSWESCDHSKPFGTYWQGGPRAADVNGDGRADFVGGLRAQDGTISVVDDVSPATGLDTANWRPADIDGNGQKELTYVAHLNTGVRVYSAFRNPDGTYAVKSEVPALFLTDPSNLRWLRADVGGPTGRADKREDLVYVDYYRGLDRDLQPERGIRVHTLLSRGHGAWEARSENAYPGLTAEYVQHWRAMDVDNDGDNDLVLVEALGPGLRVYTLLANGDGTWTRTPAASAWPGLTAVDAQNWRVAEVNGDGKRDLVHVEQASALAVHVRALLSRGDGTWTPSLAPAWPGLGTVDTPRWRMADVSGDGLTDLLRLRVGSVGVEISTLLSTGHGWVEKTVEVSPKSASPSIWRDVESWLIADSNRDGSADLMHVHDLNPGLRVDTLLSNGDGTWTQKPPESPEPDAWPAFTAPKTANWFTADLDGDGADDLARVDYQNPGLRIASLRSLAPSDLVARATSEAGGVIEIAYRTPAGFDQGDLRTCHLRVGASPQLVFSVTTKDGRGQAGAHPDTTTYSYECARWSHRERALLGWEYVTARRDPLPNRPASETTTRYDVSEECHARVGNIQLRDGDGKLLGGRSIVPVTPGTSPPYRCLTLYEKDIECNQTTTCRNVDTYFSHDQFGNLDEIHEYGLTQVDGDERTTSWHYHPAPDPYIVGLVASEGMRKGIGSSGTPVRVRYFCYDGDLSLPCIGTPSKGLLTQAKDQNDRCPPSSCQPSDYLATTTYGYDARGNLRSVRNPRGHAVDITYEQTLNLYPESRCDALGHCTTFEWDTVLGQPTSATGPNGDRTEFSYDPLGRPLVTTFANGSSVRRHYLDWGNPSGQRLREVATDGSEDGLWADTYVDGLGRPYRLVKEGDVATRTFQQETTYLDSSALVSRQSHWYASDASPVYETFAYDAAGRLVSQTHPDAASLRWSHGNDRITSWTVSTDELGHERTVHRDAYGRPAKVLEGDASTSYTYSVTDDPLTITDSAGNVARLTWDWLGRPIELDDPDLGKWEYEYDLVGNLLKQTDARGRTQTFTYDALERVRTRTSAPSGDEVTWNYDEKGHGASAGRLTSILDPSGEGCPDGVSETLDYDAMGEVATSTKCVRGQAYTTSFRYDALTRPSAVIYPDGEEVTYSYDAAGRLERVPRYVELDHDAAGRVIGAEYANGTTAVFTYDPKREWLNSTKVTADEGTRTLFDAGYTYGPSGLVDATTSTTNRMNLGFAYDDLDRLEEVRGDINQEFRYDNLGNITYNSAVGEYDYPVPGAPRCSGGRCGGPHAARQAGPTAYSYDANGNMERVDDEHRGHRRITWNDDNLAAALSDFDGSLTTFLYDASGARVAQSPSSGEKRAPEIEKRYFGPLVEHSEADGLVKYYYAGPLLVARRDSSGTTWYHQDSLGSTRALTGKDGSVLARFDYTPFGETLQHTNAVDTDIRFTGHRRDEPSGLIYMNARYYDPALARFISADSIVPDPLNPQALNRYSFVYNNPLSYTDPSGHEPVRTCCEYDRLLVVDPPMKRANGSQGSDPSEWISWKYASGKNDPGLSAPPLLASHQERLRPDPYAGLSDDQRVAWESHHAGEAFEQTYTWPFVTGTMTTLRYASVLGGPALYEAANIAADQVDENAAAAGLEYDTSGGETLTDLRAVMGMAPSPSAFVRSKYMKGFKKARRAVLKRDPICPYCDKRKSTTADHLISVYDADAAVGAGFLTVDEATKMVNDLENLLGVCVSCNSSKKAMLPGNKPGHWLPPNPSPQAIIIMRRLGTWSDDVWGG
jgi:RHS repeat-associated protein